VLPVRLFGDPVLTTQAEEVTSFDAELRRLVRSLDDTLHDQRGSGLAAPQVGVGLRVFVFHDDDASGHLVNPVLSFPNEEEQDGPEGCLSMPGLYFDTKRRQNVVAKGLTARGDPVQLVGAGNLARCLSPPTTSNTGAVTAAASAGPKDHAAKAADSAVKKYRLPVTASRSPSWPSSRTITSEKPGPPTPPRKWLKAPSKSPCRAASMARGIAGFLGSSGA
jgi:peptide deformylase